MIRILFLSDTHLGFDDTEQPRVERRRRGPDFFANFERALEPARRREVDVVVHGGDVFYRSKIPPSLVERAFRPLAALPVPVLVVPGNHERSRIPWPLFAMHRNVFIFDRPRTFVLTLGGERVAFGGFPFDGEVRGRFGSLLAETGVLLAEASTRVLCMHQAVEGARVGTPEFVFTRGADVIRAGDIPAGFAAVLSGHIHRGQRLPLASPVFYPGSIERTSFAERLETKGYLVLSLRGGAVSDFEFRKLPARPMFSLSGGDDLRARLASLPPDAIVRIDTSSLTAAELRAIAPPEMNIDLARSGFT